MKSTTTRVTEVTYVLMEKAMKGMIGVYQMRSRKLGKSFVGATLSMGNKFIHELTWLFSGQHPNAVLQQLCDENGIEDMEWQGNGIVRSMCYVTAQKL